MKKISITLLLVITAGFLSAFLPLSEVNFGQATGSELTHINAIKSLLDRYGIDDPAAQTATGVFLDPGLQDLYNQLLAQGSQSLADAIEVGAAVEEMDILDLQSKIEQASQADILQVYENLEAGSHNHLRAFVFQLKSLTGEEYIPKYLSTEEYRSIIAGTAGNRGQGGPDSKETGGL